jgi:hypothetical protein
MYNKKAVLTEKQTGAGQSLNACASTVCGIVQRAPLTPLNPDKGLHF